MPTQEMNSVPALLILEDGMVFHGRSFGKIGTTSGELCFNTGMTGYQEVFTDPSYYGQVLIMNNVHTGNYGVKAGDVESETVKIKGLIGRNLEEKYSRLMADDSLQNYLVNQQVVAIEDIDTRALVTHIREKGAMNCIISSENTDVEALMEALKKVPSMDGLELASVVSTAEVYHVGDPSATIRIAVLDFGVKRNIIQCMADRGAYVRVHPAKTSFEELLAFEPVFGICLGHQLLALANGIKTFKMHHGHRGLNHPVKNLMTGLCEITTQNHGFAVDADAVRSAEQIEVTHINLNDDSIEGIRLKDRPAFSVQYHPEATPGPHDSRYLFDDFINLIHNN